MIQEAEAVSLEGVLQGLVGPGRGLRGPQEAGGGKKPNDGLTVNPTSQVRTQRGEESWPGQGEGRGEGGFLAPSPSPSPSGGQAM